MRKGLCVVLGMMMLLCVAGKQAGAEMDKEENFIGLGLLTNFNCYEGKDNEFYPFPLVWWRKDRWFIQGNKAGWVAYEEGEWRTDLFLSPRLLGFDAGDAPEFDGMSDRKWSLDGGARVTWRVPAVEGLDLALAVTTDLLNENKGQEAALSLSKAFKGSIYKFVPGLGVKWQSKNMVDYYYGVKDTEAKAGRPEYKPNSVWNPFLSLGLYLGMTENSLLIIQSHIEFPGNEILNSPITLNDSAFGTLITGVVFKF